MRLIGKPTKDYCSVIHAGEATEDTRCDTRRLHVYRLLPSSVVRILRWQHAALYGRSTSNKKPWRPCHGAPTTGWTVGGCM